MKTIAIKWSVKNIFSCLIAETITRISSFEGADAIFLDETHKNCTQNEFNVDVRKLEGNIEQQ